MKRVIYSATLGVALALVTLWCFPLTAFAQTHGKMSGAIAIASGDSVGTEELSRSALHSTQYAPIPYGSPFSVYVTSAVGAAVDADSFHVFVQTRPEGAGAFPTEARSWMNLARLQQHGDSTDYPMLFSISPNGFGNGADTVINPVVTYPAGQYMFRTGVSLGQIRVTISGSDADSVADGAGDWRWHIVW